MHKLEVFHHPTDYDISEWAEELEAAVLPEGWYYWLVEPFTTDPTPPEGPYSTFAAAEQDGLQDLRLINERDA